MAHGKPYWAVVLDADYKANQAVYRSPGSNGNPDYIPAFKGPSGRLSAAEAFAKEASELTDASEQLDMRLQSHGSTVFGNPMFSDAHEEDGQHPDLGPKLSTPRMVKMNSFFETPAKHNLEPSRSQKLSVQISKQNSIDNRRYAPTHRVPSHASLSSIRSSTANGGTAVHAFDDGPDSPVSGDTGYAPVVARIAQPRPSRPTSGPDSPVSGDTGYAPVVARIAQPRLSRPTSPDSPVSGDTGYAPVVARIAQPCPSWLTLSRGPDLLAIRWENDVKEMIQSQQHTHTAYKWAAPRDVLVKCYVKRVKHLFGTHCSFQMHLENGDVFLLAARRRKKSKASSYVISQDLDDLKRDTDNCVAKLKANFTGTEYMLWGQGGGDSQKKGYTKEEACINFKHSSLTGSGGPRSMLAGLPLPDSQWLPGSAPDGFDSLSNSIEMARNHELSPQLERELGMLATKPAEYDEASKSFTLDFKGRVKEGSVKNFQLVHWDHSTDRKGSNVTLQFGKIEEDLYALDFSYPFNMEVAFAIAIASIDTKLCYSI
eukprot:gene21701-28725_t